MAFLLDTNVLSDLVRRPHGRIADRIAQVGEQNVCTSIIVAAELRYGAARKASPLLSAQLETVLGALEVLALESPVDVVYGELIIRTRLERAGRSILDHTVVIDNEREFSRIAANHSAKRSKVHSRGLPRFFISWHLHSESRYAVAQ